MLTTASSEMDSELVKKVQSPWEEPGLMRRREYAGGEIEKDGLIECDTRDANQKLKINKKSSPYHGDSLISTPHYSSINPQWISAH